jgi:hypothetical protein
MKYILVCAPATAPTTAAGSVFDRCCWRCQRRVMIAPTGQRLLRKHPDTKIQCLPCTEATWITGSPWILAAANRDELRREKESEQPNFWKERN